MKLLLFAWLSLSFAWANDICHETAAQKTSFWYQRTAQKIDEAILDSRTDGLKLQVTRNMLVTQSYLHFFQSQNHHVSFMGYVYAHASHHLGRLVRYKFWEQVADSSDWKKLDYSLIQGRSLERTVATFPKLLSTRLMDFSLDLYKTLATQLSILDSCGAAFAFRLTEDPHLKLAYTSHSLSDFMRHFVAYEQSYLQKTMYAQLDIMTATKSGMLDPMRFIPFNGERTISFAEWKEHEGLKGTSFDLTQRIRFDQMVINFELRETENQQSLLLERLNKTRIESMLKFLKKSLE
jgi:hypothetical protein